MSLFVGVSFKSDRRDTRILKGGEFRKAVAISGCVSGLQNRWYQREQHAAANSTHVNLS